MKIGVVTQWFAPEPVPIPGTLAQDLAERGHEVRVLTGYPNYPDGKVYTGFRQRWNHTAVHDGVTVRRVPLYPSHDASGTRRAANYLSFSVTSSMAAPRFLKGVDVVYVYLTPATVFAAPALLRLLRGTPAVVHVQDLWPESVTMSAMGPGGRAGRAVERILHVAMRRIYRAAAGITVIAPSMRDIVVARGADPRRVRVVLNWTDEDVFRPVTATDEAIRLVGARPGRRTVMYAGAMGSFQNVEESIRAAVAAAEHIDLVLVGSGIAEKPARRLAEDLGAVNVRWLGRRPMDEMPGLYAAADYQLVTLRDLPIFRGTIPSKLQAALACGAPVVVTVPGDCAALVENNGVGLACPPDDWRLLADRFIDAAKVQPGEHKLMSGRARHLYETRMSRRAGVDQIEDLLTDAASRKAAT
jgi:glycosyltransferase involved in cell wall biosynthesis